MRNAEAGDYGKSQFVEAAVYYRAEGHEVFSPYEAHEQLGKRSREVAMRYDIPRLLECDVLVAMPGWRDSRCCRAEVSLARCTGIEVWDEDMDFLEPDYERLIAEGL
jgi:hypothetical protein